MVRNQIRRLLLLLVAATCCLTLQALPGTALAHGSSEDDAGGDESSTMILVRITQDRDGNFRASAFEVNSPALEVAAVNFALNRELNLSPLCPSAPVFRYGNAALAGLELRIWQDKNDTERFWYSIRPEGGNWKVAGTKRFGLGPEIDGSRSFDLMFPLQTPA